MEGIFLCHSSKDKQFARKLRNTLQQYKIHVWLDEAEMLPGDSLIQKIEDGISKSRYFAVVLSPTAVKSRWVQKELATALTLEIKRRRIHILPILYLKCALPVFLLDKIYADFTIEGKYDNEIRRILGKWE